MYNYLKRGLKYAPCILDRSKGQDFKYIMIRIQGEDPQLIVRGSSLKGMHKEIYEEFRYKEMTEEERMDLNYVEVKGGGRVRFSENHILVYSYSQAFGRADHAKASKIIKENFPDYEVTADILGDD